MEYAALHQLLYLYAEPQLETFLGQLLPPGKGMEPGFLFRCTMELQLLRGEWTVLRKKLAGIEDAELQAIDAAVTFLQGGARPGTWPF